MDYLLPADTLEMWEGTDRLNAAQRWTARRTSPGAVSPLRAAAKALVKAGGLVRRQHGHRAKNLPKTIEVTWPDSTQKSDGFTASVPRITLDKSW